MKFKGSLSLSGRGIHNAKRFSFFRVEFESWFKNHNPSLSADLDLDNDNAGSLLTNCNKIYWSMEENDKSGNLGGEL